MDKRLVTLLIILSCAATLVATAQDVLWSVDLNVALHNREGGDQMRPDQTFFFTRLAPEVGLTIDQGRNRIMGGVAWYQPMNDHGTGYKVLPTIYYAYRGTHLKADLGMFPRSHVRERAPRYLWSDSLNYCQPNVRGAMLQYEHRRGGWMQAVLDWRQMQTRNRREAFNVLLSGALPLAGPLWLKGHIYYNHLAKRKDAPDGEGVNDDATITPLLALQLHPGQVKLNVETGAIVQLQRTRAEHKWHTPAAFTCTANARWRWLEVEETFKAGKDLFPLYDAFGPELNLGDPYYRDKIYSRTDVRAHLIQKSFVDVSAMLTFHATDRVTGFWQQLSCRFYVGGMGRHATTIGDGTRLNPLF
ncbi:MAG: hypothetical protein IJ775_03665 [Muribaculaceae bacterium]|nr:hypothetical protein [Muribaculaceae bacterium]